MRRGSVIAAFGLLVSISADVRAEPPSADKEATRLAEIESELMAQLEKPDPTPATAPETKASLARPATTTTTVKKETKVISPESCEPVAASFASEAKAELEQSNNELRRELDRQRSELERLRVQKTQLEKIVAVSESPPAEKRKAAAAEPVVEAPAAAKAPKPGKKSAAEPKPVKAELPQPVEKEFALESRNEPDVYESLRVPNPQITESGLIARTFRPNTPVRLGPSTRDSVISWIPTGTDLEIETRVGNWYRIRTPQRNLGWIPTSVVIFRPAGDLDGSSATRVQGYDPEVGNDLVIPSTTRY